MYLDGLGWIPVDVTPGCYYDTFALLQMAEQPQDIEMTAALKDSEDPGELLDDPRFPTNRTPDAAAFASQRCSWSNPAFVRFCSVLADRAGSPASAADKPLAAALERRFGAG